MVIRVILVILKNDEIQDNFVMPLLWTDRPNHSTQQATILLTGEIRFEANNKK